jgi:long-chain acyl-CoA synthetase
MTEQSLMIQPPLIQGGSWPDAPGVRVGDHIASWDEIEQRGRAVAQALTVGDAQPGMTVAIAARNCVEWAELVVGNIRSGGRLVPVNWHLTAPEMAQILEDSGTDILIVDGGTAAVGRAAAELARVENVVETGPEYEQWRDAHGDELLSDRRSGSAMMFTGGTTGRSKGVNRSDQNMLVSERTANLRGWAERVYLPLDGPMLITTPVYHAIGLGLLERALLLGLPLVMDGRFDAVRTLELIERHQIASGPMVPTQFVKLLKLDPDIRSHYDVSSLQWILHTAAPCPGWVKRDMIDWFGPVIYELYGSTEGTGPAMCTSEEWLAHPGTVGRATAGIEYSIVGEDGSDLPVGEIGTIYCRRADGSPDYHGDPEKTAAMKLPDGRFTVGDLGSMDEDGFLYLADRRVDLIITRGANVYPAEVEGVLLEHPAVADVAVFGIPHVEWGQEIMAVIEPAPEHTPETIDLPTIIEFASERLAAFKLPSRVESIDALPREAHGKLKKRILRDAYYEEV